MHVVECYYETNVKKGFLGFIKDVNKATDITTGVVKGLAEGTALAGAISIVGKNCEKGKGITLKTVGGILGDLGKVIKVIPSALKNIFWSNSVKENLSIAFKKAKNAVPALIDGAKKHKATAALAATALVAMVAVRAIQGKINANMENANLDHATNNTHA